MYKFFDKQFLVLPDDEDIIGKKVFYNDDFLDLIKEVESGDYGKIGILEDIGSDNDEGNFCVRDANYGTLASWHLAYYDPNYEAKVAYSQGKKIQYRTYLGEWVDVVDKPLWCVRDVYRVKPEKTRHMTNRELMRWLAEGKGERLDVVTGFIALYYSYAKGMDDEECDKDIRIREWDENEWHEPLVEVKE